LRRVATASRPKPCGGVLRCRYERLVYEQDTADGLFEGFSGELCGVLRTVRPDPLG
jgi:hypothetical protein